MKKVLIGISMVLIGFYGHSQSFTPEIYVGANGGVNASMVYFKPSLNQTFATGINSGLSFRYISEKNLGLQLELNYIEKGWNQHNGLIDIYTRKLNYLELPFLTHLYFGKKTRFYFEIGPQISYLINDLELLSYYVKPVEVEQTYSLDHKFDYGGAAGLGISFQFGAQLFQIGLRGSYSLNDIFSNNQRDYFDHSNNIVAQSSLTWMIQTNYKKK